MKTLTVTAQQLKTAIRWDIDFHLPPVGIKAFPKGCLVPISRVADIIKKKRDPTAKPEVLFKYVDIASVDVETGVIARPQELTGLEAPSRAKKVIHAYDIIISTCRPTRGAIAVIPEDLHGEICSTGFSVVRAKENTNPFYLHFALRLDSTLEQFRKWSTGSSYPAILDEDVAKTLIPVPDPKIQDQIAKTLRSAAIERDIAIRAANDAWKSTVDGILMGLSKSSVIPAPRKTPDTVYSIEQVRARLEALGSVLEESLGVEEYLFDEEEDE
jgi:type I restriction enzyme S subunit